MKKTSRVAFDGASAPRLEALAKMVHRPTAEIVRTSARGRFGPFSGGLQPVGGGAQPGNGVPPSDTRTVRTYRS